MDAQRRIVVAAAADYELLHASGAVFRLPHGHEATNQ